MFKGSKKKGIILFEHFEDTFYVLLLFIFKTLLEPHVKISRYTINKDRMFPCVQPPRVHAGTHHGVPEAGDLLRPPLPHNLLLTDQLTTGDTSQH